MEQLRSPRRRDWPAAGGTRELIVIAQDTTYYGLDLYGERRLGDLLRRLCRIDGIEWLRLHYAYPAPIPRRTRSARCATSRRSASTSTSRSSTSATASSAACGAGIGPGSRPTRWSTSSAARCPASRCARRCSRAIRGRKRGRTSPSCMQFVARVTFRAARRLRRTREEEGTYSAHRTVRTTYPKRPNRQRVEQPDHGAAETGISREHNLQRRVGTYRARDPRPPRRRTARSRRTQYDSPEVDTEILISSSENRESSLSQTGDSVSPLDSSSMSGSLERMITIFTVSQSKSCRWPGGPAAKSGDNFLRTNCIAKSLIISNKRFDRRTPARFIWYIRNNLLLLNRAILIPFRQLPWTTVQS